MANYFDEQEHKYYIDEIEVPSVTEIAEPISFNRLNDLPKHILNKARIRGSKVHELAEEYLLVCEIEWEEIEPEFANYLEQFIMWARTYRPKVLYTEYRMFSNDFAGTCDLICKIDDKTILVDYKTTSTIDKKSLSVQLEGYKRLCALYNIDIDECYYLHLKKDGYVFKPIKTNPRWFDILLEHNKFMKEKIDGRK